MPTQRRDDGTEINAEFCVESIPGGFDLIIESGDGHGRNDDYREGVELHLSRMKSAGMILQDLQVASTGAMEKPEEERRVTLNELDIPLPLATVSDVESLRLSIGRASAGFGRHADKTRGNYTKKVLLRMRWADANDLNKSEIEHLLTRPVTVDWKTELPVEDTGELEQLADRAFDGFQSAHAKGDPVPIPVGRSVPVKSNR